MQGIESAGCGRGRFADNTCHFAAGKLNGEDHGNIFFVGKIDQKLDGAKTRLGVAGAAVEGGAVAKIIRLAEIEQREAVTEKEQIPGSIFTDGEELLVKRGEFRKICTQIFFIIRRAFAVGCGESGADCFGKRMAVQAGDE